MKIFNFQFSIFNKRGVVVLPTVLMLGGLVVAIALTGSVLMYLLSSGTYGKRLSTAALAAARGGLQDGIVRVIRNNSFIAVAPYNVVIGLNKASVTVLNLSSSVPEIVVKEIISQGAAINRYRRLRAVVQMNTTTGVVDIVSIEEQAIP